jgi:hypothetical protein
MCLYVFLQYHWYPLPYARQLVVSHSDPEFKTLPGSATCKGLMTQYMPELVCTMKPQRWWSLDDASLTSLFLSNPYAEMSTAKVVHNRAFDDPWPRRPYHTRETGPCWSTYWSIEPTVSPQKLCVTRPFDDLWPRWPYHTRETGPCWSTYRSIGPFIDPKKHDSVDCKSWLLQ